MTSPSPSSSAPGSPLRAGVGRTRCLLGPAAVAVALLLAATLLPGGSADARVVKQEVRQAIDQARAERPVPRPLRPRLADLQQNRASLGGCDYNERQRYGAATPLCPRGDATATRTMVVVGDSHGRHWIPAIEDAARTYGWRTYYLVLNGCTAARVRLAGQAKGDQCASFQRWTQSTIERLRPDVVVASSTNPLGGIRVGGEVPSTQRQRKAYRNGTARFFRNVEAFAGRRVLLRDVPTVTRDAGSCLRRAQHLGQCLLPRDEAQGRFTNSSVFGARDAGVPVANPTRLVCGANVCPSVVGNRIVYRNDDHLTVAWTRTLGQPISNLLGMR